MRRPAHNRSTRSGSPGRPPPGPARAAGGRRNDDARDALLQAVVTDPSAAQSSLGAYLAGLRAEAAGSRPDPSDRLSSVLDGGLAAPGTAADGILTFSSGPDTVVRPRSAPRGTSDRGLAALRSRGRTLGRVLVTKFAAFGLLSKAAVAGATVTVAASSAGAAGVLPPPAQVAFDEAVGRQVAAADADPTGEASVDGSEGRETGVDGGVVARDARGEDGEPGVDGRAVADEASNGKAGGVAPPDAAEAGRATAEERSAGRAGGQQPDPSTTAPGTPTQPAKAEGARTPAKGGKQAPGAAGKGPADG